MHKLVLHSGQWYLVFLRSVRPWLSMVFQQKLQPKAGPSRCTGQWPERAGSIVILALVPRSSGVEDCEGIYYIRICSGMLLLSLSSQICTGTWGEDAALRKLSGVSATSRINWADPELEGLEAVGTEEADGSLSIDIRSKLREDI